MKKNNVFHLLVNPNFIVFFLLLIFILVAIYPYIGYDEALYILGDYGIVMEYHLMLVLLRTKPPEYICCML